MTKQGGIVGAVGRRRGRERMNINLSLEVIVDCLGNVVTQSSEGRMDEETHTPKGAEWVYQRPWTDPSLTPTLPQAWQDWP